MKNIIEQIAKKELGLETLEASNSGLDFKEHAVWAIEEALKRAYIMGMKAGLK